MELREIDELVRTGAIVEIPWQKITPDNRQPRRYFARGRMAELTGSIEESEQALPAVVRPLAGDPEFEYKLVDGERRWRAAKELDLSVPCIIKEFANEDDVLEFQVKANFNREGHTPLETCNFLHRLLETRRFLQMPKKDRVAALGRSFGKSELWAWQYLGLKRLHPDLKKLLDPRIPKKERIPVALAIKLSGFERNEQLKMFKAIRKKKLNVKGARRLIDQTNLKKGLHAHRKGRRPADDLEILVGFLRRVEQEVAIVLQMSDRDFKRMFASRDADQRTQLMEEMDMAVTALDRVRQRTKAAFKSVPVPRVA